MAAVEMPRQRSERLALQDLPAFSAQIEILHDTLSVYLLGISLVTRWQALDDELKGPMEAGEMSRQRAERLALQEAAIATVTSLLPALEPVDQVRTTCPVLKEF